MDIAACKSRLAAKVPEIAVHRIQGAAEFAELVEKGTLPQGSPFAYLLPTGLRSEGRPSAMSGIFAQGIRETLGVVLGFRTHSATAEAALEEIDATIHATLAAFCGWAPDDQPGVFEITSGRLTGFQRGAAFYQLEFAITDQLRITP